jgi:hypothetical protein
VISRFLAPYGPATLRELADWSGWSLRAVQVAIDQLVATGAVVSCQLDNAPTTHYVRQADVEEIQRTKPVDHALSFLACYDPVVRAQQTVLGQRYGYGCAITTFWHYLLVDGEWCGALHIHYKMNMLWIRELLLDEPVLANPSLLQEVLDGIRRELTYGLSSIRIDWINGTPADSPANRALLSSQGYVPREGSYVLDLTA